MNFTKEQSDIDDENKNKIKKGILERIGDAMGFGKTVDDIKKNPDRIDAMQLEGCFDRNGNPKKCDKAK